MGRLECRRRHTDAAQPSATRPPISELVQPFEQGSLALVPLGDPQPQRFHFQVLHLAGVRAVFPGPIAPVLRIPERSAALFDPQRPVGHGVLSVLKFGCRDKAPSVPGWRLLSFDGSPWRPPPGGRLDRRIRLGWRRRSAQAPIEAHGNRDDLILIITIPGSRLSTAAQPHARLGREENVPRSFRPHGWQDHPQRDRVSRELRLMRRGLVMHPGDIPRYRNRWRRDGCLTRSWRSKAMIKSRRYKKTKEQTGVFLHPAKRLTDRPDGQ
jgi:hypothetical protein